MAVRQRRRRQPERGGKRDRFSDHKDAGAAAGAAAGNSSADVVRGGMAADEAVGNNFYLTPEALKRDEQTARKIYSVIKEQVKHECSSKGRITECRQNIGRIIEFTQDKRFDGKFKDLKKNPYIT